MLANRRDLWLFHGFREQGDTMGGCSDSRGRAYTYMYVMGTCGAVRCALCCMLESQAITEDYLVSTATLPDTRFSALYIASRTVIVTRRNTNIWSYAHVTTYGKSPNLKKHNTSKYYIHEWPEEHQRGAAVSP